MIKEAECWSLEHTGVGLSETELELVKFLEEKFTSTNKQSTPLCVCGNNSPNEQEMVLCCKKCGLPV